MKNNHGFTIVEMAIVLLIVGLLLGGLMMPLTAQIQERRINETQKGLEEIREALIGYAASQTPPRLPCPDKTSNGGQGTANDGIEDYNAANGRCIQAEGNIPWVTLGVGDVDAWGNHYHYRVNQTYADRTPTAGGAPYTPFSLNTVGTMRVCQSPTCTIVTADTLPAVILSYGKNGRNAITASGVQIPPPPSPIPASSPRSDEYENANSDDIFVMHPPALATSPAPAGEFDDQVIWLSSNMLYSRMIAAQKLP